MSKRKKMRLASLVMFVIAVIFVFCAISNPTLGRVIYIGDWALGETSGCFVTKYMR